MQTCQKKTPEQMVDAIFALDLDPIKLKLMDKEDGCGWTRAEADRYELEYRRFLALIAKYPEEVITPTRSVDRFWHGHILDTMKYAQDCENVFGYFLHHFPYFGMRDAEDAENSARAAARSKALYAREFGGAVSPEGNAYCAKAAQSYCAKAAGEKEHAYCAKAAGDQDHAYCARAVDDKHAYCAKSAGGESHAYCAKTAGDESHAYCAKAADSESHAYCAKAVDGESHAYCAKAAGEESHAYCAKAVDGESHAYCAKAAGEESHAYCAKAADGESPAYCAKAAARSDAIVTGKGRPKLEAAVA